MNFKVVPLLLLLILLLTAVVMADQYNDTQARIYLDTPGQKQMLRTLGLDIVWTEPGYVEIITNPAQLESLAQLGFKTEVIHESVGDFYRSRLPEKDMGGYKTLAEVNSYMDGIIADHPDLASTKIQFGTTIEGRPMWAFKISDNPNTDEDEPELLFTAAVHAREVNTPDIIFYYVDHITDNYGIDPEITDLIDNREIWIIPCCNPDGYFHNQVIAPSGGGMWRMNRRDNLNGSFGVDINRNYGYQWGYDDEGSDPNPGSPTYRGTGPFSEPETQALRDFCISHDFILAVHWHQYSNVTIYPWAYDYLTCPDDDIFRALGDTIYQMNGYEYGLIVDMISYAANGGAYDWDYGEQTLKNKTFSMTIEAGTSQDGFWPTLIRAQQQREENLDPQLFLTRLAGNIYQLRGPEPPEIVGLPVSVDGSSYTVSWIHDDLANPGVNYELVELLKKRIANDPAETLDYWETTGFSVSTSRAYSGTTSLYSGQLDRATTELTTVYPYMVGAGDELRFMTYYDMNFYTDFMYVEITTDGQTYESIPGNLTSDYNPYGRNRGNGISGSMGEWVEATFDLSAYVGQGVWFRIVYEADEPNEGIIGEGVYIDDFYPHLVFDTQTLVASNITETSYAFTDKPLDVYYYQVRAQDAEGQWGAFSWIAETDVLGTGTGDIDLDGINSSIADLTLFNLYFQRGLAAFDVYPTTQIAQSDINLDGVALSQADAVRLAEIVLGSATPYYAESPASDRADRSGSAVSEPSDQSQSFIPASDPSTYAVEIQTTLFEPHDSVYVDIVLTEATAGLLGFQFHVQLCDLEMALDDVRLGSGTADWQTLDFNQTTGFCGEEVTLIGMAQGAGGPVGIEIIGPPSLPATLVRLKLTVDVPSTPSIADMRFAWNDCGDNTIVSGHAQATDLVIDYLALSNRVYNSNAEEITGLYSEWGGADYTCYYGLFGDQPQSAIDFTSGRLEYSGSCCAVRVGDANGLGGDEPTIGDVSAMVDAKFLTGSCDGILACLVEADINQSGGIDATCDDITIGDISTLIDYLFITGPSLGLPDCL